MTTATYYHVSKTYAGGDLLSLVARIERGDLTDEQARELLAQTWGEADNWTERQYDEYMAYHAQLIHLHDTREQAEAFAAEFGGTVYTVNCDGLDVRRDNHEYDHPVVARKIDGERILA